MESHETTEFKRVMVVIDGSDNATRAAKVAVALARKFGAELIVCHAIPTPSYSLAEPGIAGVATLLSGYFAAARKDAEKLVADIVRSAETGGVKAITLIIENIISVVEAIVGQATKKNVDLIVIGTRGLSGFKKLSIGSVSSGVVGHAHCTVMVVRELRLAGSSISALIAAFLVKVLLLLKLNP